MILLVGLWCQWREGSKASFPFSGGGGSGGDGGGSDGGGGGDGDGGEGRAMESY